MAKVYTAQEMREVASIYDDAGEDIVAAMLRQAADALEREEKREKKYEYETVELYKDGKSTGKALVRREVGEWEEVKE